VEFSSLTIRLLFAAIVAGAAGCETKAPSPESTTNAATQASAGATPKRQRAASRDVTFLAVSDTHFGYVSEATHVRLVGKLDAIAGHPYPGAIGGTVAAPRGLLVTGDLTEWGKEEEWERFLAFYGNVDGGTKVPVREVVGNHDKVASMLVTEQVAARHGGRWYAFDWDDVHFVGLGEAPDDDGLAWLARDLGALAPNVPVVLYFHFPLAGPYSTGQWFGDGNYRDRLGAMLDGRCVAAIFHGHHHASAHYLWRGIHVYKPGAVKGDAHTFAVTRISGSTVSVAYFDWEKDAWTFSHARDMCARAED